MTPTKTPAARTKALAAIEHALIDLAQKTTETTGFEWVCEGSQVRRYGENREIVIRLRPWHGGDE